MLLFVGILLVYSLWYQDQVLVISSDHFAVHYRPEFSRYARSILDLMEVALEGYQEEYGLTLEQDEVIHIHISRDRALSNRAPLYVAERTIFWNISYDIQVLPPGVYGFVHGLGYILALFESKTFGQGWAHYSASVILSRYVYPRLGDGAWPEPYNYSRTEGIERLVSQLESVEWLTYRAAAKILFLIDQRHGPALIGNAYLSVRQRIAARLNIPITEVCPTVDEFREELVRLSGDASILELFESYWW